MAHRLLRDVEADEWERSDFPIICVSATILMFGCTKAVIRSARSALGHSRCSGGGLAAMQDIRRPRFAKLVVRDTALSINSNDAIPKSDVNREYFAEEHDRRARAGIDYESSYGMVRANDTILKLQRTTPYYKRNRAHVCSFYVRGQCTRGSECPYRHEMPVEGELSQQNIKDRFYGVNDPVAHKLLNKAGEMPSLEPPEDESIRTLYVGGLDARITEQDLRDNFYVHGEIESVKMVLHRGCAFVTYTTREGAEKAAEELSNKLVIKGLRMKLLWGRPQAQRLEAEGSADETKQQQSAVTHSGLLPRSVISQQQNHLHPHPGTPPPPPPMPYFNIPPLMPQQDRTYYPSMDPQRMGAYVRSQESGRGARWTVGTE
ncbi:hypothetical protein OROGR_004244 [Orobanche gracilis]